MYSMPERGRQRRQHHLRKDFVFSQAGRIKVKEQFFDGNRALSVRPGDFRFAVERNKNLRQIRQRFAGSEIAADRAHVAHANIGDFSFRFAKHRKFFFDQRRSFELAVRHQRADGQAFACVVTKCL